MRRCYAILLVLAFAWTWAAQGRAADFELTDGTKVSGELSDVNDLGIVLKLPDGTFSKRVYWIDFSEAARKELAKDPRAERYVRRFATFELMDGSKILGEMSDANDQGAVFRLASGGFSRRTSWAKFTQEALKELAGNARAKSFVEPFIEIPPSQQVKPKPKPIELRDVPKVDRPEGRMSIFSSFTAPLGLTVLGLLYLASLYAGYEIAVYRNRPVALVCGLSALLPLLGPLVFLASPTLPPEGGETEVPEEVPEAPGPAVAAAGAHAGTTSRKIGAPPPPPGGGLRVASQQKAAGGKAEPKIFNRGEYTFNRRFIETQFAGFFRVVPSEADKDLLLVFKTPKQQYIGRRISRISSNELFLQLQQGGGTKEVSIGFTEIAQIQIRHKDDIQED